MQIWIHDNKMKKITALNNDVPDMLSYTNSTWHSYLDQATSTFDFTIPKFSNGELHEDLKLINDECFVSFYVNGSYQVFYIATLQEDDFNIQLTCNNTNLEYALEYANPFNSSSAQSIQWYLEHMDLLSFAAVEIGNNEISDRKRTLTFDSQETKMNRLQSLMSNFDAEFEFKVELNKDGTYKRIVINIYQENHIGTDRKDVVLYYSNGLKGVQVTSDKTQMFNAGVFDGKDGVNLANVEFSEKNADGVEEFYSRKGDIFVYAPLSMQRYPATMKPDGQDNWIRKDFTTEYENVNDLKAYALRTLKKYAYPLVTYTASVQSGFVSHYTDLKLGDTIRIIDKNFVGGLALEARVSEMIISFDNPANNSFVFTNYRKLDNKPSSALQTRIEQAVESKLPYRIELATTGGVTFKNNEGETIIKPSLYKGNLPWTKDVTWHWTINGVVTDGMQYRIQARDIIDTALLTVDAFVDGKKVATTEITLTNVNDGPQGPQGDEGPQGPQGDEGPQGPQGDTGNGIANTVVTYGLSMSDTTEPATWSSSVPTLVKGMYLWTRTVIIYTNGDSTTSYQISYIAKDADATAAIDKTKQELLEKLETVRDESLAAADAAKQELTEVANELSTAKQDLANSVDAVNTKVDNAKAELTQAKQDLANVASDLNTAKQDLSDSVTAVNTKVDSAKAELTQAKQQLTNVANDLSQAKTDLQNAVSAVDTKATNLKSDLSQAKQDLTSHAQQLQTQANAQTELTKRVTTVEKTANGTKTTVNELTKTVAQNGKDITSVTNRTKTVEDDLSGTKTTLSQVKTAADSTSKKTATLETGLNGLTARFDNLKIGGRNLLVKTNQGKTNWTWSISSGGATAENYDADGVNAVKLTRTSDASVTWSYVAYWGLIRKLIEPNTKYTLSFDVYPSQDVTFTASLKRSDGGSKLTNEVTMNKATANQWTKVSCILTSTTTLSDDTSQVVYLQGMPTAKDNYLIIKNIKLEKGNVATDYSPSEVDLEQKMAEYKQTADQNYASLQTTVQNLDGTVQHNKTVAEQTAAGFKTRIESLETYKDGESERANAYFESAKTETAKQLTAERTAIAKDYVAKSTYTSDVTGIRNDLSATTTTANTTKTNLANYQASNDRAVANLQSNLQTANGNISSLQTKVEAVPGQITSAVSSVESKIPTEIGAVNLLKNSKSFTGSNIGGSGTILSETYQGCAVRHLKVTGEVAIAEFRRCVYPKLGSEYAASFWAKGRGVLRVYFHGDSGYLGVASGLTSEGNTTNSGDGSIAFNLTSNWKRYWVKYKLKSEPASATSVGKHLLFRTPPNGSENEVYLAGAQLEEGNVVSGYEPAPEDTATQISNLSSEIKQTADGMTLLATKTELNTAKSDLQSGINTATNKANSAQNKANTNAQTISTHTTQISALNTGLQAKVSQTDFNTLSGRVTTAENNITAKANELSSKITSVEGKIPTEIGSTNLLRKTAVNTDNLKLFEKSNSTISVVTKDGHQTYKIVVSANGSGVNFKGNAQYYNLIKDRPYTFSFWVLTNKDKNFNMNSLGHIQAVNSNGDIVGSDNLHQHTTPVYSTNTIKANTWTKVWCTFKATSNSFFIPYFWYLKAGDAIYIYDMMLNEGKMPLSYTPAPEDTASQISSLSSELTQTKDGITLLATKTELNNARNELQSGINTATNKANAAQNTANNNAQTISTHTTQISALNTGLQAKVSQTDFNTLSGRVTTAENNITAKANELSSKITSVEGKIPTSVGGRNLLSKTNQGKTNWYWSTSNSGTTSEDYNVDGVKAVKLTRTSDSSYTWHYIRYDGLIRNLIEPNTKYTLSFDVKPNVDVTFSAILQRGDGGSPLTNVGSMNKALANKWSKVSCVLTSKETLSSLTGQVVYLQGMPIAKGNYLIIKNIKLEKGVVSTDWSPAPEDTAEQISNLSSEIKQTADGITLLATKTELNNAKNELQSGINTATNKANEAQNKANNNAQTISTHTTQISALNTGLQAKVSQTDFNTLSGRVTTAENNITAKANELSSKITSVEGAIEDTQSDITKLSSEIKQTADGMTMLATKTELNSAKTDLQSGISTATNKANAAQSTADGAVTKANAAQSTANNNAQIISTHTTQISALNTGLQAKVSQSDFNTLSGRVTTAENNIIAKANELSSKITSVEGKIPTEIGSTNLLRKTAVNTDNLKLFGKGNATVSVVTKDGHQTYKIVVAANGSGVYFDGNSQYYNLVKDRNYTFSFWVLTNKDKNFNMNSLGHIQAVNENGDIVGSDRLHQHTTPVYSTNIIRANTWTKVWCTFKATSNSFFIPYFWYLTAGDEIYIYDMMLNEGKVPLSYTPAPEDTISQISSLSSELTQTKDGITLLATKTELNSAKNELQSGINTATNKANEAQNKANNNAQTISTHTTQISALNTGLQAKVSQTDFNTLSGRVTTAENNITAKANELSSKITSVEGAIEDTQSDITKLSSEIKQTADGMTMLATKTELNSAKTDLQSGISTATNKANAAQSTADGAVTKANAAQSTANNNAQIISTHTTQISALNTGLQAKVSQSDFNTLSGRVTTAENNIIAKANELSSKITSVEGKIPTEIGAVNLFKGSRDFSGSWITNLGVYAEDYKGVKIFKTQGMWSGRSQYFEVKTGEEYVFSAYVKSSAKTDRVTFFLYHGDKQPTASGLVSYGSVSGANSVDLDLTDKYKRIAIKIKITKDGWIAPRIERFNSDAYLFFGGYKLEKGAVSSDWSPAPEDYDSKLASAQSEIKQTTDSIKASVSSLDGSTVKSSSLTINADGIVMKAGKSTTDVANAIGSYFAVNQNAINLFSDKINVKGNMIVSGAITSDKIAANSISSDKIVASGITANVIKGGVLQSLNGSTNFELNTGKLFYNNNNTGVFRVQNGASTMGLKFSNTPITVNGTSRILSRAILGGDRNESTLDDGRWDKGGFSGIVIETIKGAIPAVNEHADSLRAISDTIYFTHTYSADEPTGVSAHGWKMETYAPDSSYSGNIVLKPYGINYRQSDIVVGDIRLDNGDGSGYWMRATINTLKACFGHILNGGVSSSALNAIRSELDKISGT